MAACIHKHRLDMTTLQVKGVWNIIVNRVYIYIWTIPQFKNLMMEVVYRKKCDEMEWTFTIIKNKKYYIITILTDNYEGDIQCSVRYDDSYFIYPVTATKVSRGMHQLLFPHSVILNQLNEFLKFNIAILIFTFNKSETSRLTLQPRTLNDTCHHDFLKMYIKRILEKSPKRCFSDFVLHGKEEIFGVHKAILVARCSYFRNYIRENYKDDETGEIKVDETSDVLYNFIRFLYTGQAVFKCTKKLTVLMELLENFGMSRIQALKKLSLQ